MLALVTADVARNTDPDLAPLAAACREILGDDLVSVVDWDDPSIDWGRFDAAIVRSTWDYTERLAEFLHWVDTVSTQTTLVNGADAIRWSADKRYLAELEEHGIPVAPSIYVEPGAPAPAVDGVRVVKPSVGASSVGARRCEPDEVAEHVATLHADGLTAMVQPYLDLIDQRGETSLCFVPTASGSGVELSHAFGKAAILTSEDFGPGGMAVANERIGPRVPSAAEVELADRILSSPPVAALDIAFARLDLVPSQVGDDGDKLIVLEVELIEPSFRLATADGSAELLARRMIDRFASGCDVKVHR